MLDEVKKLDETLEAAMTHRHDTLIAIEKRRDTDENYTYNQAADDRTKARQDHSNAVEEAWAALRKSDNKLVAYIAKEHWYSEAGAALVVLKALPLDYTGLVALAKEHDWCRDFDRALNRASAAGVVEGITPEVGARRELRSYLSDACGIYSGEIEGIMSRVDTVVKMAIAAHNAEMKAIEDAQPETADL